MKRLEEAGVTPTLPVAPPAARSQPAYQSPEHAVATHDWPAQFLAGGVVVDGLRLSLAAPAEPFAYGPPYYLYLGLENHASSPRTLDALPACGSLSRADTLVFRVRSDGGTETVVPNEYVDTTNVHEHPPLTVEALGSLTAVVNFFDLVAGSAPLFELYKSARSLTVTAEVPALQLRSNAVTFQVAGR